MQRAGRRRRGRGPAAGDPREPAAGRVAGPGRGAGLPELGARRGARRRRLRRRHGAARRARSSWAPTAPLAPGLRAARAGERARPGPQQHGAAVPPGRGARGRLGPHAADDRGSSPPTSSPTPAGARPGHAPGLPAGQRRRVRGQAPQPGARRTPGTLADATGDAVRVLWRREDVVRRGPKRPPLAVALRADGTRRRAGRPHGGLGRPGAAGGPSASRAAPAWRSRWSTSPGRPCRADLRGAGWAEVLAARAVLGRRPTRAAGPRRGARRRARCGQRPGRAAPRTTGRAAGSRSTCGPARSSAR